MHQKISFTLFLLLFLCAHAQAQKTDNLALKFSLDCSFCDYDYIRMEIPYLNYVRDYGFADVHLQVLQRVTPSRNTEYYLYFYGGGENAGRDQTLLYLIPYDATFDEIREGLVKMIQTGLLPYLPEGSPLKHLEITYTAPPVDWLQADDRWKNWAFRVGTNFELRGSASQLQNPTQKQSHYKMDWRSFVAAGKVTLDFRLEGSYNFEWQKAKNIDEQGTFQPALQYDAFYNKASALFVKSIGRHWAAGGSTDWIGYEKTYKSSAGEEGLTRYFLQPSVAIEYNIFPYEEFIRRQFTITALAGPMLRLKKDEEDDMISTVRLRYYTIHKWGNLEFFAQQQNVWGRYNALSFAPRAYIRLHKGLFLDVSSELELFFDDELRSTHYFTGIGLSYTFGSQYSNVVNPVCGMYFSIIFERVHEFYELPQVQFVKFVASFYSTVSHFAKS